MNGIHHIEAFALSSIFLDMYISFCKYGLQFTGFLARDVHDNNDTRPYKLLQSMDCDHLLQRTLIVSFLHVAMF